MFPPTQIPKGNQGNEDSKASYVKCTTMLYHNLSPNAFRIVSLTTLMFCSHMHKCMPLPLIKATMGPLFSVLNHYPKPV